MKHSNTITLFHLPKTRILEWMFHHEKLLFTGKTFFLKYAVVINLETLSRSKIDWNTLNLIAYSILRFLNRLLTGWDIMFQIYIMITAELRVLNKFMRNKTVVIEKHTSDSLMQSWQKGLVIDISTTLCLHLKLMC